MKSRRVAKAASTNKIVWLNSCLETGPDLVNNRFGLLVRFRDNLVAVSADIDDMCMQVGKREEEKNGLCFLWPEKKYKEKKTNNPDISLVQNILQPLPSNNLCHQTGADYCLRNISESFNRDDFVHSIDRTDEKEDFITQLNWFLWQSGYNLTKFVSNAHDVIHCIDIGEISTDDKMHFVLGVKREITDDTLFVQTKPR